MDFACFMKNIYLDFQFCINVGFFFPQRFMLLQQPGAGTAATKVVCLTQVVTADELRDDEEYEDIVEDMKQEGIKFG